MDHVVTVAVLILFASRDMVKYEELDFVLVLDKVFA